MGAGVILTAKDYFERAKVALEKKDMFNFMEYIGSAVGLAQEDQEFLGEVLFVKVKGLMNFSQHRRVLEFVPVALKLNDGANAFRLKKYNGLALAHLGYFDKGIKIFKDLLDTTNDRFLLVEAYTNLVWAYLMLYNEEGDQSNFDEIPGYLEFIHNSFEEITNEKKILYYTNYCTYLSCIGKHEEAIETQEQALQYCEERDLPRVYNNLAALYLKLDEVVPAEVHEYTEKVEIIANKYNDYLEMAKTFNLKACAELREDQLFKALDTMYLSMEYFKKAEAYHWAFDCLVQINEIVNDYKIERLQSLKEDMKGKFVDTAYYNQI